MHAFIRRFLMHYGIYRRYPLGRLPALRNAWRTARALMRLDRHAGGRGPGKSGFLKPGFASPVTLMGRR